MINNKKTPIKNKVIKLYKSISYNADVSASTIFEQSTKALITIDKLEALGYKVDLYVVWVTRGTGIDNHQVSFRVKIKSASRD